LHEIAADYSGFDQLVEFVADSLMPPEQQGFVACHRQRRWFTLMELDTLQDHCLTAIL
jgi:hypothetical protein